MPFVKRDATGAVAALFRERAADATEYLTPDHPAVRGFAAAAPAEPAARARLLDSDLEMLRVYEDLIDVLMQKRLVLLTDFPPAAQGKLLRHKRLRDTLQAIGEGIQAEGDGIL